MRHDQPPPTPLRIPEDWKPEIEVAAVKRGLSKHAFLLRAIRRVLDGEKTVQDHDEKNVF